MFCKKNKLIKIFLSLSIFFSAFLSGCDILWFGNFGNDLREQTSTKITFFSGKEEEGPAFSTTRFYKTGVNLKASDLPDRHDAEIAAWNTAGRIGGWNFYRTADGINIETSGVVSSYTPDGNALDLFAIWHYPYKVEYYYENLSDSMEFDHDETLWDKKGALINPLPEIVDGFTFSTTSGLHVSDSEVKVAKVEYSRKTIDITFDANGGAFSDSSASHLEQLKFGKPLLTEEPVMAGYTFKGWLPQLPATVPSENVTYVAQWLDSEFTLTYADWNAGGDDAKLCSAVIDDFVNPLPLTYNLGVEKVLPDPISSAKVEDTIEFGGYYYDADCTNSLSKNASGKYYLKSTDSGDKTIYLKWKYKNVYVDPVNGNDRNTGHNATSSLKTIKEAKKYLACGQDDSAVIVLNTMTDTSDIAELSGISKAEYHNAVVKSNPTPGSTSIITLSGKVELSNVKIISDNLAAVISVNNNGELWLNSNVYIEINGSYDGIVVNANGKLAIFGDYTYVASSSSPAPVLVKTGANEFSMSNNAKIISTQPVILQDNTSITINGTLAQTGILASIKASNPASAPYVLKDTTSGYYVSSYYKQFESAITGYSINSAGQLVTASGINLDPVTPTITEYDPGELATTVITKVSGGDTFVTFDVTNAAYEKIAAWGTDKYIQYTIDGKYGNVVITGSAGSYKAVLNLTSLRSGTDPSVTLNDLRYGLLSLVIYAEPENPLSDVITAKEYQIFVK